MKEIAIKELVRKKFLGKTDKGGHPYIEHCIRVADRAMRLVTDVNKGLTVWYIGLLHDILEDTDTTIDELKACEYVTDEIIEAVKVLTRNYYNEESYFEYINRISKNDLARIVKISDIKDNIDITRLPELTIEHFNLLKRYHKAYNILTRDFEFNQN